MTVAATPLAQLQAPQTAQMTLETALVLPQLDTLEQNVRLVFLVGSGPHRTGPAMTVAATPLAQLQALQTAQMTLETALVLPHLDTREQNVTIVFLVGTGPHQPGCAMNVTATQLAQVETLLHVMMIVVNVVVLKITPVPTVGLAKQDYLFKEMEHAGVR